MTTRIDADVVMADHGLESKHRTLWAMGDYTTVATEVVSPLGPVLVQASGIGVGDRVLDVAAGAGNAAIPAALTGANVVASDLVPELLERGAALAQARGVNLQWREANAEALPFGVDEFDAVLSCVGVMFVPHHQCAADELVRVCRPGGTIGLISWTPEGFIGQMFAMMKPYVATPRFIVRHLPADSPRHAELPQRLAQGRKALTVMESHLTGRSYFIGDRYSVADIALYAYTHVAEEGGLSLESFPQVRAWLARVATQPLHVRIHDQPTQRL